jgi:hypothetical protein
MDILVDERLVRAGDLQVGQPYQQGERDGQPVIVIITSVQTVGYRTVLGPRAEQDIDPDTGLGGYRVYVYHRDALIPVKETA